MQAYITLYKNIFNLLKFCGLYLLVQNVRRR